MRQKLATFQVEHRDHVERIRSLLALIVSTSGPPAAAQLEEVFRRAHTLKGAARVVELRSVEGLAHSLETLLARVRHGDLALTKEVSDLVLAALDAMDDCVAGLTESAAASVVQPALQAIQQFLGIEPQPAAPVLEEAPAPAFQALDTVRINARNFDGLLRSAVELLTENQRQSRVTLELAGLAAHMGGVEKEAEGMLRVFAAAARRSPAAESSPTLTRLADLARQARMAASQVNSLRRLMLRTSYTLTRLGKQLQRDVLQARMVPVESLIEGYRKMMRDLARDEAKQFEFRATTNGEQADRRVLEALKDPLMHALRNAVSHGIEPPEERLGKGKPAAGLVTLRFEGDSQRLRIAVEDDGRGLDSAKIVEIALRRKLLSETEAQRFSLRDVTRLLFSPGFSTASTITTLAGRGMGLSVVYEAVKGLQGEVDLQARSGGGTSLQLLVPVSIAMQKLLLVSCAKRPFAIPLHWIERLLRVPRKDVETLEGKPAVRFDGQATYLLSLQRLLKLQEEPGSAASDSLAVMIIRLKGERTAIAVDAFLWQREAVIQSLGPATPRDGKISGGISLEDGSLALVIDPPRLIESSEQDEAPGLGGSPAPARVAPSILVVDDSITTRTLEKSILEAHGYRVRMAVDGEDGLAQLRAEKADLVIADVQMPRMDGFELLEAIKKDRNLTQIPVIVLTSLGRREDCERGLKLGAEAYIVKKKFDQEELLAAIRQILGSP